MTAQMTVEQGRAGFEAFYRSHRDHLYRALSLTLRDRLVAGEAVDEALTRAYERWDEVQEYSNPVGWVYRVAYNFAVSRFRKEHREVPGANDPRCYEDTPEDVTVIDAINCLAVDHRTVVVMRYYLDWSTSDIAESLGVPAGTVKSRLHRALEDLENKLGSAQ